MNILRHFIALLQLREAVRKADDARKATGNRHFVVGGPTAKKGKPTLMVVDRNNFRILKRKGYITSEASVKDLINESFYFTPCRDGSGWLTEHDRKEKAKRYFIWYRSMLCNKAKLP